MRVLLTRSEGYLGCLLGPDLVRDGHDVLGVDTGFYKHGWLYNGVERTVETLARDVRRLTDEDLRGVDAAVHMAELSNNPLGDLIGDVTYQVNHRGSVRLAELAKQTGSRGLSTCRRAASTASRPERLTNPQTVYALRGAGLAGRRCAG